MILSNWFRKLNSTTESSLWTLLFYCCNFILQCAIEKKKEDVQNIATEADFLLAVEDDIIISESDDRIFNILSDKFDDVLQHGSHYLPNLFLKYLLYLI